MARFYSPDGHEDHAEPQSPQTDRHPSSDGLDLGGAGGGHDETLHRLSGQMMADAKAQPLPRELRELALQLAAALAERDGGGDDAP